MHTVEEARALYGKGEYIAGMEPPSDFIISAKTYYFAGIDIEWINIMDRLINNNLHIASYSEGRIEQLIIEYLILPPYSGKGVNWQERKYYRRSEKKYCIDIRFPDYEKFCTATKDEALSIMAQQTIRATDKYLSKEKFFKYNEFKNDLVDLFKKNGLLL